MKKPNSIDYICASVTVMLIGVLLIILCAGCSHNPAQFVVGNHTRIGFGDYGTLSVAEGLLINDIPRENTSFEVELDSESGVSYDPATGTVKGVKKVTRHVGPQITGYLVDLAHVAPEAALEYLKGIRPDPEPEPEIIKNPDYPDGQ